MEPEDMRKKGIKEVIDDHSLDELLKMAEKAKRESSIVVHEEKAIEEKSSEPEKKTGIVSLISKKVSIFSTALIGTLGLIGMSYLAHHYLVPEVDYTYYDSVITGFGVINHNIGHYEEFTYNEDINSYGEKYCGMSYRLKNDKQDFFVNVRDDGCDGTFQRIDCYVPSGDYGDGFTAELVCSEDGCSGYPADGATAFLDKGKKNFNLKKYKKNIGKKVDERHLIKKIFTFL